MSKIKDIRAREILDSRGNPTVEVDIVLSSGVIGKASVPSGASTGLQEACELRDGGIRYGGKGVLKAIESIETEIRQTLVGTALGSQNDLDDILINLDGTPNKSRLGANALLAVSIAFARATALDEKIPLFQYLKPENSMPSYLLPVPMMNLINGGAHADNSLDLQEFMVLPVGASHFKEAIRCGVEIFQALKLLLRQMGFGTAVGDEGGFAPNLPSNEAAIEILLKAIEAAGFKAGYDVYLGLDLASSEFYQDSKYTLRSENKVLSSEELVLYLKTLVDHYPIISIEDGMAEDDFAGWKLLTDTLGERLQLVGDDLFVTNTKILFQGIREGLANAILIKPNQIGTLSETLSAIKMAKEAGYGTIISHRSGETEDTLIADLSVATNAGQIKAGSLCRTDRVAKYNQLLRIEEMLGSEAQYAGKSILNGKI